MTLVLTIEGAAPGTSDCQRRLERGRLSIGRGGDNDWVLPDPERYLSKQHCVIEARGDRFFLTDTSSNGTYLDDASDPVGRSRTIEITDGSRVRLGDYVLEAALPEPTNGASGQPEETSPRTHGSLFDDPLESIEERQPERQEGKNLGGLFDESWIGQRSFRKSDHPSVRPKEGIATPSDHISPEHHSLDWGRSEPEGESLFDDTGPPSATPPRGSATGKGPFFDEADDPFAKPAEREPVSETPPTPAPGQPPAPGAGGTLAAFLDGAGMDRRDLAIEDEAAFMREAGEAFRELASGLAQLLANRAMIKREIGVDQTLVGAMNNNPLKLSANDQEAVLSLLKHRGPGYLAPLPAIHAAHDDLRTHELAIVEAMQTALTHLLKRFDPEQLERELAEESRLAVLIAGGRKGKVWDIFKERYGEIAQSARERFLGEVGGDFARAYERRSGREKG